MKILFIHHLADMYGSSQSLLRLTRAFIQDGNSVHVLLHESGPLVDALKQAGANVSNMSDMPVLHRNRIKSPSALLKLLRHYSSAQKEIDSIILETQPDIIHSNTAAILPFAGKAAKKHDIPFIQHYRESFHDFGFTWNVYRSIILKYATRVISISDFLAEQYTPAQKVTYVRVARNGIPIEEFDPPPPEDVQAFKNKWGLTPPVVTLVGRIKFKRKGQEVFVQAAALLRKSHPDTTFLIAGTPFPGNESHLDELKQMIRDLNLSDCVILTGEVPDVRVVLANTDVSVMASSTPEPLGNVTMESMAMRVPVVGTSIGGTPELMIDGVTGLLVPPSDPEAMANALSQLLDDPQRREEMGRAGRIHFEEKLSFHPFYRRISAIYDEVLDDQP